MKLWPIFIVFGSGLCIGFFIAALMAAAGWADREEERMKNLRRP